ncbi:MAG TPA: AAA family ATPase [Polyangium sp.]|nr:AAA family ATPase [Polyangium sp.]
MIPEFPGCNIIATLAESARFALYRGHLEDGTSVLIEATRTRARSDDRARLRRAHALGKELGDAVTPRALGFVEHAEVFGIMREDPGGTTLAQILETRRILLETALAYAAGIARALAVTAAQGVVHRNLTPQSVLIRETDGAVFLVNFTAAGRTGDESLRSPNADAPEGTLLYMSPEQTGRTNRPVDHRADFYALGILLYEMLTGHPPFTSQEPMVLVHAQLARAPKAPHELEPSVPPAVSRIVLKLLAKSADDRYQSARGVAADISMCIDRLRITGRVDPFPLGGQDRPTMLTNAVRLYGRDAERETLSSAVERIRRGGREMFAIQGAEGMGKTALAIDMFARTPADDAYLAAGKFDQIGQSMPFAGIGHALGELVRAALAEPEIELARIRNELEAALGPNIELVARVVPELGMLFTPTGASPDLGPLESQNRFSIIVQRFLAVFTRRRPVVLFLDDLQWADPASLKLLRDLLSDPQGAYLLVMTAFRSRDDGEAYGPIRRTLDELQWADVPVTELELRPLRPSDVRSMIAGLLGCDSSEVESLGVLLWSKTSGNPFFVRQILGALVRDGLVDVDAATGAVYCDEERVEGSITDDIVSLLLTKIGDLSPASRYALVRAACFGHEFRIDALAALCERTPMELRSDLSNAVADGLVLPVRTRPNAVRPGGTKPSGPRAYRFSHDKVQQAAYSLLPKEELPALHLAISRRLRADIDIENDNPFEVLFHAHRGASAMTDPTERVDVARFALAGGQKARGAAAYEAAAGYFATGMMLLGETGWQQQSQLMFSLAWGAAACAYLTGRFDEAEKLFALLRAHAASSLDRASVRDLETVLYVTMGRFTDAVRVGCEGLRLLGENSLDEPDRAAAFAQEQTKIDSMLNERRAESMVDVVMLEDPNRRAVLRTLIHLVPAAYATDPALLFLVAARMVRTTLEGGPTEDSAFAFAVSGMTLTAMQRYEEAFHMCEIALRLFERFPSPSFACKVYLCVGSNLHFYRRPLVTSIPYLERAQREGLATGDFPFVSYTCFSMAQIRLGLGEDLAQVEQEIEGFLLLMQKTRDLMSEAHLRVAYQLVRCLRGRTRADTTLSDREFDEAKFEQSLRDKNLPFVVSYFHAVRLQLAVLFGEWGKAEQILAEVERYIDVAVAQFFATGVFFRAALLAALHLENVPENERAERFAEYQRRETKLVALAENCPQNFLHRLQLVRAERARIEGRDLDAINLFDAAIEGAAQNGFIKDEAFALERAARHHWKQDRKRLARAYVIDAHHMYGRWGAMAKREQLSIDFDELWEGQSPPWDQPAQSSRVDKGFAALDTATVIHAAQAIAGEILLERVLVRVVKAVIESAGADRGMLLIDRGGRLWVDVTMQVEPEKIETETSVLAEEYEELPVSVVEYVRRTREPLVMGDARADRRFAKDRYMVHYAPRSILATPMMHKGKLVGIIYLEHTTAHDAFVPTRLPLIEFLAAQAAVAVESALVYAEVQRVRDELHRTNESLEAQVEKRTQEARETADMLRVELEQRELAESEREALQMRVIEAQRERLAELSTPIIPITDDVVVMPLIGTMDESRAGELMQAALRGASERPVRAVILDVTGVKNGDARVAETLVQTASALRLLGAQAILTGVRADVARSLMESGTELAGIVTKSSLQAGIAFALGKQLRGRG